MIRFLAFGLIAVLALSAASAVELKVAVVDMQVIIDSTKEGKKIKEMLNKETAERQVLIESKRNEIKKLEDEFSQKQLVLSASVREEKQKELQNMMFEWQKLYMDSEKNLKQKYNTASQDIVKKIQGVITKVASDRSYDFVLEKQQTQFYKTSFDITQDIVRLYDQTYK